MPDRRLVAAHRAILADLARAASVELVDTWDRLGSYDRGDHEDFLRIVSPAVTATAVTAARAQDALALATTGDTAPLDLDVITAAALAKSDGPFKATWHALSEGRGYGTAVEVGRSVTEAYGRDVSYGSARGAMSGHKWPRFQRDVSGDSCEWCQSFVGVIFTSADAADFGHDRCNCVVIAAD